MKPIAPVFAERPWNTDADGEDVRRDQLYDAIRAVCGPLLRDFDPTRDEFPCIEIAFPRGELTLDDCPMVAHVSIRRDSPLIDVKSGPPVLGGVQQIVYEIELI